MEAITNLIKITREELHNYERPITYLAWQNAEINRDRKKQRKPHKIEQFYHYANEELSNMPEPKYGAAAMELIRRKMFPGWALFVFNDLKARAGDALPPEILCFQCSDAILLAPDIDTNEINGMLIIDKMASEKMRIMESPCGIIIEAMMPKVHSSVEATEDTTIRLLRIIKNNQTT